MAAFEEAALGVLDRLVLSDAAAVTGIRQSASSCCYAFSESPGEAARLDNALNAHPPCHEPHNIK